MNRQNRMLLFWVTTVCCLTFLIGCGKTTTVKLVDIDSANPSSVSDSAVTKPNSVPTMTEAAPSDTTPGIAQAAAPAAEAVNRKASEPSAGEEAAGAIEKESAPVEAAEPVATEGESEPVGRSYILNGSSKKIHYPNCSAVKKMAEKNKQAYTGTVAELKAMGYSPCGICRPN